jgi:hypothetical protein
LEAISSEVVAGGGQILLVTSESQTMADRAKVKWELPSLKIVGDPSLSLARHLKQSGLLDVFISIPDRERDAWTAGHPFMYTYTNGIAQPATLIVSRDREAWYAHTVVPERKNGGGATDRPHLPEVWQQVKQCKLEGAGTSINPNSIPTQTLGFRYKRRV